MYLLLSSTIIIWSYTILFAAAGVFPDPAKYANELLELDSRLTDYLVRVITSLRNRLFP